MSQITITAVLAHDIRFPTSENLDGSDAMNEAPDYSAAYAILKTDSDLEGHGLTFTIGRGNELCVAALPRSREDREWSLHAAQTPRLLDRDVPRVAGGLRVPRRHGVVREDLNLKV